MDLRLEQREDHTAVRRVHLAAFGDHGRVVTDLVDDLRQSFTPVDGLSLVAEEAGQVVGHVLFTRSLLDAPRRPVEVQVLSPVAVLPERQRQGIGSALIRRGLDTMAERAVPVVFLEGDPSYYSRLGFRSGAEQGFRRPSLRIPEAAFQAITLPTYEPWMSGSLVYSETFWRHDTVGLRNPGMSGFAGGQRVWVRRLGGLRNAVRQELIGRQLDGHVRDGVNVLDVGCGQGTQAIRLARRSCTVIGVDPSQELLERFTADALAAGVDVDIRRGRLEDLDALLGDRSFDVVCAHGLLMYLDDPDTALAQLAERLEPGGILSVTFRNAAALAFRPGMRGQWHLVRYGEATLSRRAFAFDGTVTGTTPSSVSEGLPGYLSVTFDVRTWFRGGHGASVTLDMFGPTMSSAQATSYRPEHGCS